MNEKDFPIVMGVEEIKEILNLGTRRAYEIMDEEGFPLIRIGRHKRVNRDDFFQWLEQKKVTP